jgi:aryl-phospho-beta-D-glucosidase BglC (GH1 family)
MYILLDMHNYAQIVTPEGEFIIGSNQISIADISDAWLKIASEFKSFDNIGDMDL